MNSSMISSVIDNGTQYGFSPLAVTHPDGIARMKPYFIKNGEKHWVEQCDRMEKETAAVMAYDTEHGIKTNFYRGWNP